MKREGLTEEVVLEQRPERSKGVSHPKIKESSFSGKTLGKSPRVGMRCEQQ